LLEQATPSTPVIGTAFHGDMVERTPRCGRPCDVRSGALIERVEPRRGCKFNRHPRSGACGVALASGPAIDLPVGGLVSTVHKQGLRRSTAGKLGRPATLRVPIGAPRRRPFESLAGALPHLDRPRRYLSYCLKAQTEPVTTTPACRSPSEPLPHCKSGPSPSAPAAVGELPISGSS
jgi:hypothetical protein